MRNIQVDADPQTIPGFVLWQVSKLWQRYLSSALMPFGIGSTEFTILGNTIRLTGLHKQATQISLSEVTKVDRMTVSQTIRSLEKKGLIKRKKFPDDKRTFTIVPTDKGIQLADDALKEVIKVHAVFFDPVKNELKTFLAIMQQLIEEAEKNLTKNLLE